MKNLTVYPLHGSESKPLQLPFICQGKVFVHAQGQTTQDVNIILIIKKTLTRILFLNEPDTRYTAFGPVHPHQQRQRPLLWHAPWPPVHLGSQEAASMDKNIPLI